MIYSYFLRFFLCSVLISVLSCATAQKIKEKTAEPPVLATPVPTLAPTPMATLLITPQVTPTAYSTPKPVFHKNKVSSDVAAAVREAISGEVPSGLDAYTDEVLYTEEDLYADEDEDKEIEKRLQTMESEDEAALEKEIAQMKAAAKKSRLTKVPEQKPTPEPEIVSYQTEEAAEPTVVSEYVPRQYQTEKTKTIEQARENEKPLQAAIAGEVHFWTPTPVAITPSGYQKLVRKEATHKSSRLSILIGIFVIFITIVVFLIWQRKKQLVRRIQVKPIPEEHETKFYAEPKEEAKIKHTVSKTMHKPEHKPAHKPAPTVEHEPAHKPAPTVEHKPAHKPAHTPAKPKQESLFNFPSKTKKTAKEKHMIKAVAVTKKKSTRKKVVKKVTAKTTKKKAIKKVAAKIMNKKSVKKKVSKRSNVVSLAAKKRKMAKKKTKVRKEKGRGTQIISFRKKA